MYRIFHSSVSTFNVIVTPDACKWDVSFVSRNGEKYYLLLIVCERYYFIDKRIFIFKSIFKFGLY